MAFASFGSQSSELLYFIVCLCTLLPATLGHNLLIPRFCQVDPEVRDFSSLRAWLQQICVLALVHTFFWAKCAVFHAGSDWRIEIQLHACNCERGFPRQQAIVSDLPTVPIEDKVISKWVERESYSKRESFSATNEQVQCNTLFAWLWN